MSNFDLQELDISYTRFHHYFFYNDFNKGAKYTIWYFFPDWKRKQQKTNQQTKKN